MTDRTCIAVFATPWLPTLNEYIRAERGNRYAAATLKRKASEAVAVAAGATRVRFTGAVELELHYYAPNKRTDKDNVAFAKKYVLDGMQEAGMIANDGWDDITAWTEHFHVDEKNPRITVTVRGYGEVY